MILNLGQAKSLDKEVEVMIRGANGDYPFHGKVLCPSSRQGLTIQVTDNVHEFRVLLIPWASISYVVLDEEER